MFSCALQGKWVFSYYGMIKLITDTILTIIDEEILAERRQYSNRLLISHHPVKPWQAFKCGGGIDWLGVSGGWSGFSDRSGMFYFPHQFNYMYPSRSSMPVGH